MHVAIRVYALLECWLSSWRFRRRLADGIHNGPAQSGGLPTLLTSWSQELRKTITVCVNPIRTCTKVRIKIRATGTCIKLNPDHLQPSAKLLKQLKRAQAELGECTTTLQWLITSREGTRSEGLSIVTGSRKLISESARARIRLEKLRTVIAQDMA